MLETIIYFNDNLFVFLVCFALFFLYSSSVLFFSGVTSLLALLSCLSCMLLHQIFIKKKIMSHNYDRARARSDGKSTKCTCAHACMMSAEPETVKPEDQAEEHDEGRERVLRLFSDAQSAFKAESERREVCDIALIVIADEACGRGCIMNHDSLFWSKLRQLFPNGILCNILNRFYKYNMLCTCKCI